jgi:hypothetical protein
LTIAAAIAYHFDRTAPRKAAVPIYTAAAIVVGGMLAATMAAPIMLNVRHLDDDSVVLQQAFNDSSSGARGGASFRPWPLAPFCGHWSPCSGRLRRPYESSDIETGSLVCVRRFCGSTVYSDAEPRNRRTMHTILPDLV